MFQLIRLLTGGCTGLAVQNVRGVRLVHGDGEHRVDVRRGSVLTRPSYDRRIQRQSTVQGLLLHRVG